MRRILFVFVIVILSGSSFIPAGRKWVIESNSRLYIHGFTNLNSFTCSFDCYDKYDTLEYLDYSPGCELIFRKNRMSIPVRNFDCGNAMITNDFWETLQAEKYPDLHIRFLSLSELENITTAKSLSGKVEITLAGVCKEYAIDYLVKERNENGIVLESRQAVCFSDFNLNPPQKMMGLIRVKEDLEVEFRIYLRPV